MKIKYYETGNKVRLYEMQAISPNSNGQINISKTLANNWGVVSGTRLMFAQDEDHPENWYMRMVDEDLGTKVFVRTHTTKSKDYTCNNKRVCNAILKILNAKRSAALMVAKKPTEIDGEEWYQIMVKSPIRVD